LAIPEAKKLASGASMSRSRLIWVIKRGALTLKTKPGGVSSYQVA
jgi:hypothetical protein